MTTARDRDLKRLLRRGRAKSWGPRGVKAIRSIPPGGVSIHVRSSRLLVLPFKRVDTSALDDEDLGCLRRAKWSRIHPVRNLNLRSSHSDGRQGQTTLQSQGLLLRMDFMSSLSLDATSKTNVQGSAKALIKGLALVELVAADAPLRLVDLVNGSGLPRPTALRLLDALRDRDVLKLTRAGEYVLGPRLAVWGQQYLEGLDLRAQAEDIMAALSSQTRETCFLGVRDGGQVLYVAKADSSQAVRPAAGVGDRNPLHSTGIGKALLAFGPEQLAEGYLREPLEMKTPNTITDPQRLRVELDTIRRRGYSVDDAENEDGVRCVAAAVMDHTGRTEAAISVSAPAYRFELEDLPRVAPKVIAAAREISRRLGFRSPDLRPAGLSSGPAHDEVTS